MAFSNQERYFDTPANLNVLAQPGGDVWMPICGEPLVDHQQDAVIRCMADHAPERLIHCTVRLPFIPAPTVARPRVLMIQLGLDANITVRCLGKRPLEQQLRNRRADTNQWQTDADACSADIVGE